MSEPVLTTVRSAPISPSAASGAPRRARRTFASRSGLTALGSGLLGFAVLVMLWECASLIVGDAHSLPSPYAVASQAWQDRAMYGQNLPPTLTSAAIGFLTGNALAVGLGLLLALIPIGRRELLAVVVILYNIPIISVGPLLEVLLSGNGPKIVMAALSVFFVTLVGTIAGMAAADCRGVDVVRAAGGGRWAVIRKVRIQAALPSIFAGFAAGVPFAIVGAMVGEFFGGQNFGLGILLVQALDSLDAARVWGVALVVAIIGGFGLVAAKSAIRVLMPWGQQAGIASATSERARSALTRLGRARGILASTALTVLIILGIWVGGSKLLNLPPYVVKMPWDIWSYLVSEPGAGANRSALISNLATSFGQAIEGCVIGVAVGAAVAIATSLIKPLRSLMLPAVIALSSAPYLALVPILAVAIGRGTTMVLALAAIIALLPTVLNLEVGLGSAPAELGDVLRAAGGGRLTVLRKVQIPAAFPSLFISLRIAAPWALYGVVLAEFLATGGGIGGSITNAAEVGDYDAAWSGAIGITIASVLLYLAVGSLERGALRRFGVAGSDA